MLDTTGNNVICQEARINFAYCLANVMPTISGNAWKVLCYLLVQPTATYEAIEKATGIGSEHTIQAALKVLTSKGYLTTIDNGRWAAPTYQAHPDLLVSSIAESAIAPVADYATPIAESAIEAPAKPINSPVAESATLKGISLSTKEDDHLVTPQKTIPPVVAEDFNHPAIKIWADLFPNEQISPTDQKTAAQLAAVRAQVSDLDAWRVAVQRWRDEKYAGKPRHGCNLAGMLNYYAETVARQRPKVAYMQASDEPRPVISEAGRAWLLAQGRPGERKRQGAA